MLTRDQIIAIYDKAIEDQPRAGQDVREANSALDDAIMAHTIAVQFETFLWAYALGYQHGQEASA